MSVSMRRYPLKVGPEWREPADERYLRSVDPATGETWYEVAEAAAEDVDAAVRSARRAFDSSTWRDMAPQQRGKLLRRIADLSSESADRTAEIEARDNGKLIRDVRAQHRSIPEAWDYFAGWPDKLAGGVIPSDTATLNYVRPEPVGVVAAIVPWNSPLASAVAKLAPALAAGNCVVVKPSEHTSASLLEFTTVLEAAGVPSGVVSVVTGRGSTTGAHLASHEAVDLITFTGGTETGRRIAAMAARRPIRALLELGGKSAAIVFDDADLELAVSGIAGSVFALGGQTCVAASRCFVHERVYDDVLGLLAGAASSMQLGDPFDDRTDLGPLAFEAHMERVLSYIESGQQEGARLAAGGFRARDPDLARGFYVAPTIFEAVRDDMRIVKEEIFGPVVSVTPFREELDVVRAANDTPYGLAAGIWTNDLSRAHRLARMLNAGTVWVNTYRAFSTRSPFGGFGDSGYGKESGEEAMWEYSRVKSTWIALAAGGGASNGGARQPRGPA
jgi:(Z)-2-((N-methylformamido)methylene)-5-hydroxybutyrolactone dehydrogenase